MVIPRHIYKKIEKYFYGYLDIKERQEIDEEDIVFGTRTGTTDGGMSNAISRNTENRALKLIDHNENHSEEMHWIEVVEETKRRFEDTDEGKIIELYYHKEHRRQKILRELHIEEMTFYIKRNDIVTYAAIRAQGKGLIDI